MLGGLGTLSIKITVCWIVLIRGIDIVSFNNVNFLQIESSISVQDRSKKLKMSDLGVKPMFEIYSGGQIKNGTDTNVW